LQHIAAFRGAARTPAGPGVGIRRGRRAATGR